jgi:hypothetical protein
VEPYSSFITKDLEVTQPIRHESQQRSNEDDVEQEAMRTRTRNNSANRGNSSLRL